MRGSGQYWSTRQRKDLTSHKKAALERFRHFLPFWQDFGFEEKFTSATNPALKHMKEKYNIDVIFWPRVTLETLLNYGNGCFIINLVQRMVERVHEIQDAEDAEREERDVVGD
jgi:hypothetical protein